jgi:hypothetical protein
MIIDEYFSDDELLKAQIMLLGYTYKVLMFNNEQVVEIREFKGKTLDYVKDYCENYVQGVMQL